VTCTLCGFQFDETQAGCRPSCPMSNGCNLRCCPNCGHGAVTEGPIAQRLRKLLVRLSLPRRSP
jgi:hypothetical protein